MAKFFTLAQADSLLPEVERLIRSAVSLHEQHQAAESGLESVLHRITVSGGTLLNPSEVVNLRNRAEALGSRLREVIAEIQSLGCQVKDLRLGLVDFPTLFKGREVLLCWKLGEERIEFWHGLQDGYAGRNRIDEEFIENHKGDPPN
jgi:hypothetical protein